MAEYFTGLTMTQVAALNQAFLHMQVTALPHCELVGMVCTVRFEDGSVHTLVKQETGWMVDPPTLP